MTIRYKDAFEIRDADTNKLLATAGSREDALFAAETIAAEAGDAGFTGIQGSGRRLKLNVVPGPCSEVDR